MVVKELNSENFDDFVKGGDGAVVDFSAEWCGPCKVLKPIFGEASGEAKTGFGAVDVDKESELAQKFQVMSVPTLIFFKDGEMVDRFTGVMSKEELVKKAEAISK